MDWSSLSNEQLYAMAQSSQEAVRWAASQELFKRRGGRSVFQQGDVLTPESSTWGAFVDAQSPEGGVVNPNFQASYQAGLEGQPSVDLTNVQLGSEQPLGEKIMATTTASQDEATWQSLLQGNVMATSALTTMPEGMRKVQAASQLAKNLVDTLGQTQVVLDRIREIHAQFIQDAPGAGYDFGSWARNTGIQLDVAGNLAGAAVANVPTTDVSNKTTVYFPDRTAVSVNNSELTAFLANNLGATTEPDGIGGSDADFLGRTGPQIQDERIVGALDLQGPDKDIFDFLTGLYKKQEGIGTSTADIYDAMYTDGADTMVRTGSMFGQNFTNQDDAYKFLQDWLHNPLKGNIGASSGSERFYTAVNALTEWDPSATVPGASTDPDPTKTGEEDAFLKYWGTAESQRPFRQIYPGYTSLLPGYGGSPAVQRAYAQAAAPLEMQYLARQATTPLPAQETAGEVGSDVKRWLQQVRRGDQPMMMGADYTSFLRQLTGALEAPMGQRAFMPVVQGGALEAGSVPRPPVEMNPDVQAKLAGVFQDPSAQLAAFMNPFYGATAGSPQMRQALMDQITQAAQRYQYQEPSGAFLPWAIKENIGGIQNILPGLRP
jgi:hypothetical protein